MEKFVSVVIFLIPGCSYMLSISPASCFNVVLIHVPPLLLPCHDILSSLLFTAYIPSINDYF
jgi:hypothetical protein